MLRYNALMTGHIGGEAGEQRPRLDLLKATRQSRHKAPRGRVRLPTTAAARRICEALTLLCSTALLALAVTDMTAWSSGNPTTCTSSPCGVMGHIVLQAIMVRPPRRASSVSFCILSQASRHKSFRCWRQASKSEMAQPRKSTCLVHRQRSFTGPDHGSLHMRDYKRSRETRMTCHDNSSRARSPRVHARQGDGRQ